jgi:hypothetical protein
MASHSPRSLGRLTVAIAAALALACAPAYAQGDDSSGAVACVGLGGIAATAYDRGGNEPLIEDALNGFSWDPLLLTDVEDGGFLLHLPLTCAGADAAGASLGAAGGAWELEAVGRMDAVVCGTGHVQGPMVLEGPGATDLVGTFAFTFAGGVGKLTISDLSGTVTLLVSTPPSFDQEVDGGGGSGVLQMTPEFTDDVGDCIVRRGFEWVVNGALEVTFHGN